MSRARGFFVVVSFALLTLPLMPLQMIFNATSPRISRRFPHAYHKLVCRILGVKLNVVGEIPNTPSLIVSNHVSWLDIPVMSAAMPLSFIAKREVGTWPFFGWLAKLQRSVFVDRERRTKVGASKNEIAERIRNGDTLVLFPEGTSHDGYHVLPFKSAFLGAVDSNDIPVVPTVVAYRKMAGLPLNKRQRPRLAWYADMDLLPHLWEAMKCPNVEVDLVFLPPLTLGDGGRKALCADCETMIRAELAKRLHAQPEIG